MSVKRKKYSKQFKLDALEIYEHGEKPMAQIERELGITDGLLAKWRDSLRQAGEPRHAFPGNGNLPETEARIHKKSRCTYGSPRIHAELRAEGVLCNHKRVARLMRLAGIQGRRKQRKVLTTDSRHDHPVAPNRLNREFTAQMPNEKWVADITYIPTQEGWLYLAVVMDLYSRKIVGWSMSYQITADLVEDALRMAQLPLNLVSILWGKAQGDGWLWGGLTTDLGNGLNGLGRPARRSFALSPFRGEGGSRQAAG